MLYLWRKPIEVPDSDAWHLRLWEGKAISVCVKIATMPCGKPLPKSDSLEVSKNTKGGQSYSENVQNDNYYIS